MSDSVICLAGAAKPADSETVVLASISNYMKERLFMFGWFRHINKLIHAGAFVHTPRKKQV